MHACYTQPLFAKIWKSYAHRSALVRTIFSPVKHLPFMYDTILHETKSRESSRARETPAFHGGQVPLSPDCGSTLTLRH